MANSLVIKIDGDDSGFKKTFSGIGTVAQKGFGVAIKGITATSVALGGLTALSVKGYADYEQLIGGIDTLFKTSSENVKKNAANAYKTAGLSANEYMEVTMSSAAALKQSFDDTEEGLKGVADTADMAVIDMADNANKMGTSMELIQNAYQGFAKQNYTMLDNLKLGYGGTKTEMERLLADAEKLSGVKYDISNLADVYNAIHVIQTEMGITGTTAKEASETISGSVGMMKASFKNLIVGISDSNANLDELVDNFLESVVIVGKNLLPVIETSLKGIGNVVSKSAKTIVPQIVDIIVSAAPDMAIAAIELIKSLCEALIDNAPEIAAAAKEIVFVIADEIEKSMPALKPFTSLIKMLADNFDDVITIAAAVTAAIIAYKAAVLVATVAQNGLNVAIKANPYGLIISAVAALTAGIVAYGATHKSVADEIREQIKDIKESYDDAIKSIEETKNAEIAEAETAKILKDELYELESQIKSGTLTEEEAKRKREEFNTAANKLNDIIPGIISNLYDETGALNINRQAVDMLTDSYYNLAVAKATVAAYEAKMQANAEAKIELEQKKKDVKREYDKYLDEDDALRERINKGNLSEEEKRSLLDIGYLDLKDMKKEKVNLTEEEKEIAFGLFTNSKEKGKLEDTYSDISEKINNLDEEMEGFVEGLFEEQQKVDDLIKDSVKTTTGEVKKGNAARTDSAKKESKKQTDILKEQREKELRDLNYYHDMGVISDQEYYEALEKFRDKYFEEGSSEWQQYTKEIYNFYKSEKDKIVDEYKSMISELETSKNAFADKLKNHTTLQYTYQLPEITLKNGLKVSGTKTLLGDIGKQNEALKNYADALKQVKERGNVSEEFFAYLRDMSVEEGYSFAKALLAVSDTEFDNYMKEFEENRALTAEISNDIYSDEFNELKTSIEETFGQIPSDFFGIGEDCAIEYGEGFMLELNRLLETAKLTVSTAFNNMLPPSMLSFAGGGYGNVNNYSPTYYVQPSNGESTQAQLKSIHDYETLNAQRSGY